MHAHARMRAGVSQAHFVRCFLWLSLVFASVNAAAAAAAGGGAGMCCATSAAHMGCFPCCVCLNFATMLQLPFCRYVLKYNRFYDASADAQARKAEGLSSVAHPPRGNA